MLHSSDAEDWLKRGLCEAILVLCKSGLKFQSQFSINGLLAITVDQREVFLINVKETVGHSDTEPLSFIDDSDDGTGLSRDLPCGTFPLAETNTSRFSGKSSRKRKGSDKGARRISGLLGENSESTSTRLTRTPRQTEPNSPLDQNAYRESYNEIYEEDNKDSQGDFPIRVSMGHNFPNSQSREEQEGKVESQPRADDDGSGFDLALVKVEKEEEDALMASEGHLQQTFHTQLQLYNAWQSNCDPAIHNGLRPDAGRSRGRRVANLEYPGSMASGHPHQQEFSRATQQHSTQRRIAREGRCENCGTRKTTAWRRSDLKELLCNACGCYYKLHKYHRPLHMAQNEIKTRCRRSKQQEHHLPLDVKPPVDRSSCHFGGLESELNQSYFPGPIPS